MMAGFYRLDGPMRRSTLGRCVEQHTETAFEMTRMSSDSTPFLLRCIHETRTSVQLTDDHSAARALQRVAARRAASRENEARKRRASERARVGCCGELARF